MDNKETWLSGLRHLTANEARVHALHEFKSHRLRRLNTVKTAETKDDTCVSYVEI